MNDTQTDSLKQYFKSEGFGIVKVSQALLALSISDGDCTEANKQRLRNHFSGVSDAVCPRNDGEKLKVEKPIRLFVKKKSTTNESERIPVNYKTIREEVEKYYDTFRAFTDQSGDSTSQMEQHHDTVKAKVLAEFSSRNPTAAVMEDLSRAMDQKYQFFTRERTVERMQLKAQCVKIISEVTAGAKRDFKKILSSTYIDEVEFLTTTGNFRLSALSEYEKRCLEQTIPNDIVRRSADDLTNNLKIFFGKQENLNQQNKPLLFD